MCQTKANVAIHLYWYGKMYQAKLMYAYIYTGMV